MRCRVCATEINTGEARSDTFAAPPLKFVRLILSWAASYKPKRANATMIIAVFDIFLHGKVRRVIYVVPPKDLRKKGKIGMTRAKCLQHTWRKDSATMDSTGTRCHAGAGGDEFICGPPDGKADDLEQLVREAFNVKICERVGPGYLHRKVAWNTEGFSWTHDLKHTLAMAEAFGFDGKKTTRAREVARLGGSWLETGTHIGRSRHSNIGQWSEQHCIWDKTDRKRNAPRREQQDSCLVPRAQRGA